MCLIETATNMVEASVLALMYWQDCISRSKEVTRTRKDKGRKPGSQGSHRNVEGHGQHEDRNVEDSPSTSASHTSSPRTSRWTGTSLEPLRRAAQQIWRQVATKPRKGIKPEADGHRRCDKHTETFSSYFVQPLQAQLPGQGSPGTKGARGEVGGPAFQRDGKRRNAKRGRDKP